MGFVFQAEDGIRDLVRSRGLGDVYKRQVPDRGDMQAIAAYFLQTDIDLFIGGGKKFFADRTRLLYPSDAPDERSRVDLGGPRLIKKKNKAKQVVIKNRTT